MLKYLPLTLPQFRVWKSQTLYPNSSLYNIGGICEIDGPINPDILKQAITLFIYGNDSFQIRLSRDNGLPKQYFVAPTVSAISFLDISEHTNPKQYLRDLCTTALQTPFNLYHEPLYQFSIFSSSNYSGYFVKIHHIIADGWSMQILVDTLSAYYNELIHGRYPTTNQSSSFHDYATLHPFNTATNDRQSASNCSESNYAPQNTITGTRLTFQINTTEAESIRNFCTCEGISLNTFFCSLYIIRESLLSSSDAISIGIPLLNRVGRQERKIFGMFANTNVLQFNYESNCSMRSLIHMVHNKLYHLMKENLLSIGPNSKSKDIVLSKLTCINYYHTSMQQAYAGFPTKVFELYNGAQEYPLQIIIREWDGDRSIQLDFDYQDSIYDQETIQTLFQQLCTICRDLLQDPEKKWTNLCLLTSREYEMLVQIYNHTDVDYGNGTVLNLIKNQVNHRPSDIAILHNSISITYQELWLQSVSVAKHINAMLSHVDVNSSQIVALHTTHSIASIVGMLGILISGRAFLPIDVEAPIERTKHLLEQYRIELVLSNKPEKLSIDAKRICSFDDIPSRSDTENWNPTISESSLAYVLFTSGSTGTPKGVMIEHKSLYNYVQWGIHQYTPNIPGIFPLYSPLTFDLTLTSIFLPLSSGGKVIIYSDSNPHPLYQILADNKCTVLKLTPSHLALIKDINNIDSNIESLIVGGELLSTKLAMQVFSSFNGKVKIWNEYGPTEATIGCMIHEFSPETDKFDSVPIGKPIANTQIYVLDRFQNPVPSGIPGEIYISGKGTARGYYLDKNATADCFIPYLGSGQHLYRTGDLARFLASGVLEFIGRKDRQIKIRGHRVELAEIENVLCSYEQISNVHISYKSNGSTKQLIAYYTAPYEYDRLVLKDYLHKYLPTYMVPDFYFRLETIPVNQNGKIDEFALPSFTPQVQNSSKDLLYYTPKETAILQKAATIFNVNEIHLDDDFFCLGGDSISAIQLSFALKENGYELQVADILTHSKFKDMVAFVTKLQVSSALTQNPEETTVIMQTPILQWFFENSWSSPQTYCQIVCLELKQLISTDQLRQIFKYLINTHDAFRMGWDADGIMVVLEDIPFDFLVVELDNNLTDLFATIQSYMLKMCSVAEIGEKSALHIGVFSFHSNVYIGIAIHHTAIDGVSFQILLRDLDTLLKQAQNNQNLNLTIKTSNYSQWTNWYATHRQTKASTIQQTALLSRSPQKQFTISNHSSIDAAKRLQKVATQCPSLKIDVILLSALLHSLKPHIKGQSLQIIIESHGRDLDPNQPDICHTIGWMTELYSMEFDNTEIMSDNLQLFSIIQQRFQYATGKKEFFTNRKKTDTLQIRFNYLGTIQTNYETFSLHHLPQNHLEVVFDLEIDCYLFNKSLYVLVHSKDRVFDSNAIESATSQFIQLSPILLDEISNSFQHRRLNEYNKINLSLGDWNVLLGEQENL